MTSLVVHEYIEGLLELRSFIRVINSMDKAGRQTDRQTDRQEGNGTGDGRAGSWRAMAQSEHQKERVNREDTETHSACHL